LAGGHNGVPHLNADLCSDLEFSTWPYQ